MRRARVRGPSRFTSAVLLVTACLLLYASLPNLGPVMRAATATGVAGTFVAQRLDCVSHPGHESCAWSGEFRSNDGALRRTDITLYGSGRQSLKDGQAVAAVDVGNAGRVYLPQGSHEWLFTAGLLIAGYGLLALLAKRHLMPPPLRRRATARTHV